MGGAATARAPLGMGQAGGRPHPSGHWRGARGHLPHLLYVGSNPRAQPSVRTSKGEAGGQGPQASRLGQPHQLRPFRRGLPPRVTHRHSPSPTQAGRPAVSPKAQTAKRHSLEPHASPGGSRIRREGALRGTQAGGASRRPPPLAQGQGWPAAWCLVHTGSPLARLLASGVKRQQPHPPNCPPRPRPGLHRTGAGSRGALGGLRADTAPQPTRPDSPPRAPQPADCGFFCADLSLSPAGAERQPFPRPWWESGFDGMSCLTPRRGRPGHPGSQEEARLGSQPDLTPPHSPRDQGPLTLTCALGPQV